MHVTSMDSVERIRGVRQAMHASVRREHVERLQAEGQWWTIKTFHWEVQTLTILNCNYKNDLPCVFQHNERSRWLKKASQYVNNEERDLTRAREICFHLFREHMSMICRHTSNW